METPVTQQGPQLSLDVLLSQPWQLMKGQKRYIWMLNFPILVLLTVLICKSLSGVIAVYVSVENGQNLDMPNFMTNLGLAHRPLLALLFLILFAFCGLYAYSANFIVGCNIAKGIQFQRAHFLVILKRIGSACVVLFVSATLYLLTTIPILGWILYFFLMPYLALYQMTAIYHKGPFRSLITILKVLKPCFWKVSLGYWIAFILTALMCITIIGAIWGIPFFLTTLGIINREVIEYNRS